MLTDFAVWFLGFAVVCCGCCVAAALVGLDKDGCRRAARVKLRDDDWGGL